MNKKNQNIKLSIPHFEREKKKERKKARHLPNYRKQSYKVTNRNIYNFKDV